MTGIKGMKNKGMFTSERMKGNKFGKGQKKGFKHKQETIEKIRLKRKENPTKYWLGKKRPEVSGKNNCNYIDGRSFLLAPARYGDDWDKIRYLIYCRDKFTCQDCGIKGIRLDVHHIIDFLISYDNSLNNLITLCRSCHMKREMLKRQEEKILSHTIYQE